MLIFSPITHKQLFIGGDQDAEKSKSTQEEEHETPWSVGKAVGVLLGFPGLFITGGKTIVAEGTIAAAKTAEVFVLTPSAATSAPTTSVTGPLIAAAPSPAISTRGNSQ